MATRLYIASDLHAAEKAWRKFVNAIKLNVYKADAALLAGDLTGKAIVPIVESDPESDPARRRYQTDLFGVHRTARGDEELAALQRDIADVGYYSFVTSSDEATRLSGDEPARDELLHRLMSERVQEWLDLATERLADSPVPLYLIPGNDDEFGIDELLDAPGHRPLNVDGRVVEMPGGIELLACGWSNHTPWQTPREESEDELYARLDALAKQVKDPRKAVFMIHVPPHDSGLDTAPILDENRRLDRGAAHHRGLPAGPGHPRPHPRVRRRAQDRQDRLHQPRLRGQPRDPAGVPGGHRPQGCGVDAARRGLSAGRVPGRFGLVSANVKGGLPKASEACQLSLDGMVVRAV
jgi:Icc-related predicted phosphoesterase